MINLAFKFLDSSRFHLSINRLIPDFSDLKLLLKNYGLDFEPFKPEADEYRMDLIYSEDCCFSDVYLMAYILRDYGLKYIWSTSAKGATIKFGDYNKNIEHVRQIGWTEGMDVYDFLKLDPKSGWNQLQGVDAQNDKNHHDIDASTARVDLKPQRGSIDIPSPSLQAENEAELKNDKIPRVDLEDDYEDWFKETSLIDPCDNNEMNTYDSWEDEPENRGNID
ncbi:hypothetical protein [Flaviaesturariibacter amylovorans]|uniref:Uncharacterized protein n=1 Tax=Flaviaesturariibacter amylovorans TaxID=1084520 RepID=A0ABP8G886_9BACT